MICFVLLKPNLTLLISFLLMAIPLEVNHKKRRYISKSGGIRVFVKDSMNKYVELIETDSDYAFWLKLCKKNI